MGNEWFGIATAHIDDLNAILHEHGNKICSNFTFSSNYNSSCHENSPLALLCIFSVCFDFPTPFRSVFGDKRFYQSSSSDNKDRTASNRWLPCPLDICSLCVSRPRRHAD